MDNGMLRYLVDVDMEELPVEFQVGQVETAEMAIVATWKCSSRGDQMYKVPTVASSKGCSTEVWACYLSVGLLRP